MGLGDIWDKAKDIVKDIPVIGDVFGAVDNVDDAVSGIYNFIRGLIQLMIESFHLAKELINWGVTILKVWFDIILDSFVLLERMLDILDFGLKMFSKYFHIPVVFIYLIPVFLAVECLVQFLNILTLQ